MTRSALARPPGGCAASRREHMTSGYVTVAGVTRKNRRKHAIWRPLCPLRNVADAEVHPAFRSRDGAEHRVQRRYVRVSALQTPVWVLASPQLMTVALLNYVRYG